MADVYELKHLVDGFKPFSVYFCLDTLSIPHSFTSSGDIRESIVKTTMVVQESSNESLCFLSFLEMTHFSFVCQCVQDLT